MSLLNSIVKIYLKNEKRKSRKRELDFAEKQAGNIPEPPAEIAKKGAFEKVEIEGVKAFWFNKSNQSNGLTITVRYSHLKR